MAGTGLDGDQQKTLAGFVAGQQQKQQQPPPPPAPPSRLAEWRAEALAVLLLPETVSSIFAVALLVGLAFWVALTSTCTPDDWPFMLWCVSMTVILTGAAWLTAVLVLDGIFERACIDIFRWTRDALEATWRFATGEIAREREHRAEDKGGQAPAKMAII